jgi:uncharacterized damage-inducible protein DinB
LRLLSLQKGFAMDELERFCRLFDQLVEHTFQYLEQVDVQNYAAIPVDSPTMFLGSRVNQINIGSLLRHLILTETHWFESLPLVMNKATIPFAQNASMLETIKNGRPLMDNYRAAYGAMKQNLSTLTEADLTKQITFAGHKYSVIGFLWTILGHHSFHLGQIDLLLRQQSFSPPEYMEWPEAQGVLG